MRRWQADFTHYRLARPASTSRSCAGSTITPATPCGSPRTERVSGEIVLAEFRADDRLSRRPRLDVDRQRHGLHHPAVEAAKADATPSSPSFAASAPDRRTLGRTIPTTCGKVERFHQTSNDGSPRNPTSRSRSASSQALLDVFDGSLQRRTAASLATRTMHPGGRLNPAGFEPATRGHGAHRT